MAFKLSAIQKQELVPILNINCEYRNSVKKKELLNLFGELADEIELPKKCTRKRCFLLGTHLFSNCLCKFESQFAHIESSLSEHHIRTDSEGAWIPFEYERSRYQTIIRQTIKKLVRYTESILERILRDKTYKRPVEKFTVTLSSLDEHYNLRFKQLVSINIGNDYESYEEYSTNLPPEIFYKYCLDVASSLLSDLETHIKWRGAVEVHSLTDYWVVSLRRKATISPYSDYIRFLSIILEHDPHFMSDRLKVEEAFKEIRDDPFFSENHPQK